MDSDHISLDDRETNPIKRSLSDEEKKEDSITTEETVPVVPGYITFIMIVLSTSEGFTLGYMGGLIAIFREKGVDSKEIGQLTSIMYPFVLSFLGAPIVDRFFSNRIGRRKTYLIPSKIVLAIAYTVFSFFADEMVREKKVGVMAFWLCTIGLVQLFDYNALAGLRYELYGPQNTGTASFTFIIGMILGSVIGNQLLILGSSDFLFKEIFKVDGGPFLNHRIINLIFGGTNILGLVGCFIIKESTSDKTEPKVFLSNWSLLKVFFTEKTHLKVIFWLFFSCFGISAAKSLCSLVIVKRGFKKEYSTFAHIIAIPVDVVGGFYFRKLMKPGSIIKVCSYFLLQHLVLVSFALYPISFYEKDKDLDLKAFICVFLLSVFESISPWISCHFAFVNSITHKNYASTYSSTMLGVINLGKIMPTSIGISLLDSCNVYVLYLSFIAFNVAFVVVTYIKFARELDHVPIAKFGEIVDEKLKLK